MALQQIVEGTIIEDRYVVRALLGSGGMGQVYLTRDLNLHRPVCVKVLGTETVKESDDRTRFFRESQILSQLNHPNIVAFYRFGLHEGSTPYIAMEYLAGQTLKSLVRNGGLDVSSALTIALQISDALSCAHSLGVINRDIKSENIVVLSEPIPNFAKMIDFGLAKLTGSNLGQQKVTTTGAILGSAFYMSPEQCQGQQLDLRSDIYSLGCVLFETITGSPPFMADNAMSLFFLHATQEFPSLKQYRLEGPIFEALDSILSRCTAKKPDDRYDSAESLSDDLRSVMDSANSRQPFQHLPIDLPSRHTCQPTKAHRRRLYQLGSAALAMLLLGTTAAVIQASTTTGPVRVQHLVDEAKQARLRRQRSAAHELIEQAQAAIETLSGDSFNVKANVLIEAAEQAVENGDMLAAKQLFEKMLLLIQSGFGRDWENVIKYHRSINMLLNECIKVSRLKPGSMAWPPGVKLTSFNVPQMQPLVEKVLQTYLLTISDQSTRVRLKRMSTHLYLMHEPNMLYPSGQIVSVHDLVNQYAMQFQVLRAVSIVAGLYASPTDFLRSIDENNPDDFFDCAMLCNSLSAISDSSERSEQSISLAELALAAINNCHYNKSAAADTLRMSSLSRLFKLYTVQNKLALADRRALDAYQIMQRHDRVEDIIQDNEDCTAITKRARQLHMRPDNSRQDREENLKRYTTRVQPG